ncbi:RNase adapter RapZ [Porphyrobacter algicida]|uniref:RNase adapter RapZ n=1 Tax=Qipengyuania algicida TaxID=1836209 RepID=A0A845AKT8_9SPHN|nr:RNase adapter RapZ [Qipengyuania algicida]MXP29156.1 RNase adapter RapZ [Qipengyuania algicida]
MKQASESASGPVILIVSGMSGAGKSTALEVLEDLGWETIDNFPLRLLRPLISTEASPDTRLAIGIDARTRGFDPARIIELVERALPSSGLRIDLLFLDASSREIERRYNETRRRHPLAAGRPVREGIKAERELLKPLRARAPTIIDTTEYSTNQLQHAMREMFGKDAPEDLAITVTSFGFARGMPPLADLVFDMRFLANPHWQADLREQTGRDAPVGDFIEQDPGFSSSFNRIRELVLDLVPRYADQGRAYLTIAFGCTGGRHRSVFTAERMAAALHDAGYEPSLIHRNLDAPVTDATEGVSAKRS